MGPAHINNMLHTNMGLAHINNMLYTNMGLAHIHNTLKGGEHGSSLLPLAALVAFHNFFQNPKRRTYCNVFDFMILITCSLQHQEVVTKNKNRGFYQGPIIKMSALYWRVGLISAAAVMCL